MRASDHAFGYIDKPHSLEDKIVSISNMMNVRLLLASY